jgi:hypothetical protein
MVTLTTSTPDAALNVGETTSITVSALITDAVSNDGLVSYDLDLFPLDMEGIHFVGTPTFDPAATVDSLGTFDPFTGGLLGIRGHYALPGKGVGTTVNLFTIQVFADAIGPNSVSAGLSVFPSGTGIPLKLNLSGNYADPSGPGPIPFTVDSSSAIVVLDITVPEPATALLGMLGISALLCRRRRSFV